MGKKGIVKGGKNDGGAALTGNALVGDVVSGKTFYKDDANTQLTGVMVDRGTVSTDISAKATAVTIAAGKHSGTGTVQISAAEQAKIIAGNIRAGTTVLGVTGNLVAFIVGSTTNQHSNTTGGATATFYTVPAWARGTLTIAATYYWPTSGMLSGVKNGAQAFITYISDSQLGPVTYTETISVAPGDVLGFQRYGGDVVWQSVHVRFSLG